MKNGSLASKLWIAFIAAAVLAYFGVQIYRYVGDPLTTTLAYTYQIEETVELSGYVVRQEQVLEGDSGGFLRLRKNEGERVSAGGAVAAVYSDQAALERQEEMDSLQSRIEQLKFAQESMSGAEVTLKLDNQISQTLLNYRADLTAGRLESAENRGQELRSLVLKRDYSYSGTEDLSEQISALTAQLKQLRSQAANSVKTIRAPRSGLYSGVVDGYESVLTPDILSALTPSTLDKLAAETVPANAGKLILGDQWYYAAVVSAQEAETLRYRESHMAAGDSFYLRFSKNVDRDLAVTLLSISEEENGRCVAVFQGDAYLQELTLLRRQSAEIILETTEGIRVPRAALRVITETVSDTKAGQESTREVSVTGVYCVSGAKALFKPVEVLRTGEEHAVVRSVGTTEKERLRAGEEVIVTARDLYDGKVIIS